MTSDLFQMLVERDSPRNHPVFAALLYVYCPAAAHWWLAGADPVIPFDPLSAALQSRAAGHTLRDVLDQWGLGELLPYARKYVQRVEAYRDQVCNRRIISPELLPTFLENHLPLQARLGLLESFTRMGGWQNFYPFIRAWAFTTWDWQQELHAGRFTSVTRDRITVRLNNQGAVGLPIWLLNGSVKQVYGFLAGDSPDCFLLQSELLSLGIPTPDFYILDDQGRAVRFHSQIERSMLPGLVFRLAEFAGAGPHPPLAGLKNAAACRPCGFSAICWQEQNLTSLAVEF